MAQKTESSILLRSAGILLIDLELGTRYEGDYYLMWKKAAKELTGCEKKQQASCGGRVEANTKVSGCQIVTHS
jgi:hypothetical protein